MKRKESARPVRSSAPRGTTRGDKADPYQKARRPRPAAGDAPAFTRRPRSASGDAPAFSRRPRSADDAPSFARERRPPPRRDAGDAGSGGREGVSREGGFTVTLDPDVARVFRGDASVNKALRLVMQLMQVVQGPPRTFGARPERAPVGERPRGGYQGTAEARGFTRKPKFEDEDQ